MKFLFDLGGVFFDWDPNFFFENIIIDKSRRRFFLQNVCNDRWNLAQDKGRSIKKGELILIRKFPQFEKEIKMYYKNHSKMFRKVFHQSVEILEESFSSEEAAEHAIFLKRVVDLLERYAE